MAWVFGRSGVRLVRLVFTEVSASHALALCSPIFLLPPHRLHIYRMDVHNDVQFTCVKGTGSETRYDGSE